MDKRCGERIGGCFHEVPVDVVKTIWETDSLVVRIQKQHCITAMQAVPELKGSPKAPDAREPRAPVLLQLLAASPHASFRDPRTNVFLSGCVPIIPSALPEISHAEQPVLIGF